MERAMEYAEDVCRYCGEHVGFGVRFLHLRVCDAEECRAKYDEEEKPMARQFIRKGHGATKKQVKKTVESASKKAERLAVKRLTAIVATVGSIDARLDSIETAIVGLRERIEALEEALKPNIHPKPPYPDVVDEDVEPASLVAGDTDDEA